MKDERETSVAHIEDQISNNKTKTKKFNKNITKTITE